MRIDATSAEFAIPTISWSDVPSVTVAQMTEVDRSAIEDFGITLLQMMEQAGSHLAELVSAETEGALADRSVVVVVGPGNNGGGGLVAARHLANRGARVRVVLARPVLRMSEAGRHQLATLIAMGTDCCVATYDLADDELGEALASADTIVDALLGYSSQGAPYGEVERLLGCIVDADRPIISLDIPTGLDPDTGGALGATVTATATLTLALPKTGLSRGEGPNRAGRVYLGDLGLPEALYTALGIQVGRPFAAGRIVRLDGSP